MRIFSTRTITRTKFLTFMERSYYDLTGVEKTWQYVSRSKGLDNETKVVVVAAYKEATMTEGRKLVVNKEFRVPINAYQWSLPAGLIDEYESTQDAAARELKEETGLDVVRFVDQSPFIDSSAGLTDETAAIVCVEVDGSINTLGHEVSEDITTYMLDMDGVRALLECKDYRFDAKAWLIMNRFAKTGELI